MKDKLKKSALIALGGAVLVIVPYLSNEVVNWLMVNDPIDWRTPMAMLITAISTWIVNTIREFIKIKT
jgi:hypothetical protein